MGGAWEQFPSPNGLGFQVKKLAKWKVLKFFVFLLKLLLPEPPMLLLM